MKGPLARIRRSSSCAELPLWQIARTHGSNDRPPQEGRSGGELPPHKPSSTPSTTQNQSASSIGSGMADGKRVVTDSVGMWDEPCSLGVVCAAPCSRSPGVVFARTETTTTRYPSTMSSQKTAGHGSHTHKKACRRHTCLRINSHKAKPQGSSLEDPTLPTSPRESQVIRHPPSTSGRRRWADQPERGRHSLHCPSSMSVHIGRPPGWAE